MTESQVILADLLIDGSGGEPVANAAVIVDGNRIQYAGPRQNAAWSDEATVYHADDMTMMPGLIDCHDHLAHTGIDLARRAAMPPSLVFYETA